VATASFALLTMPACAGIPYSGRIAELQKEAASGIARRADQPLDHTSA
jgi:hypothetical protein